MKNRILVVGQIPPPFHGSNVMAKNMLCALASEGYHVIFIDKSFSKSIDTIGTLSLRKILRLPVLIIEIFLACLFKQPALCIYFIAVGKSAFLIDAFILFLLRLCGLPYILRFGGKGYYKLQNDRFIWHFLVSSTISNALGGIVKGEGLKSDINLFIPNDRLVIIPNATEKHTFVLDNKKDKYVQILFLSNLRFSKGPFEVLKAAKIVVQTNKNVRFVLAGAADSKFFTQKLRAYIHDNGLDTFVTMPGGVCGHDKAKLLASSDIFVFPTHFEVFPNVIIEAMNWGLPVISSREGAIPDIVQDSITGFLVDPKSPEEIANKLLTLVNNHSFRKTMGMKGREVFESKYTLEVYSKTLDDAIRYFLDKLECDRI